MTYLPHPTDVGWLAEPPPRPRSVAAAVQFMYLGATLEILVVIIAVARVGSVTGGFEARGFTANQAHGLAMHDTLVSVAGGLIVAGLWLWVARYSAAGRSWARILATVLFAVRTLALLLIVAPGHPAGLSLSGLSAILNVLSSLAGLGAVVCLWRRDASQYFSETSQYLLRPRYF